MESQILTHPIYENNFFNLLIINSMKIKKLKKANLEKKRGIYFQIGLVVSLSLVLLAFEWTTVESGKIDLKFNRDILIEDDLSEITVHKKKPEMPKPKIVQIIDIVDDETEIDDEIEISSEVTDETTNDLNIIPDFDIEEIDKEEDVIFSFVQNQPEFPGGETALYKYLKSNLKYPPDAREINLQGTVYITFVVWKDGSISDVKILRGIGGGCDEEVIRVIELMPNWIPGNQNGKKVNAAFQMPIKFKLN